MTSSRSCTIARQDWWRRMLEEAEPRSAKRFDVLDAGCGTGLCGPLLAPYARRLVGVDLSAGMLDQGAGPERSTTGSFKDELTAYLRDCTAAFDVIVSADTLVYFGALEPVAVGCGDALRPADGSSSRGGRRRTVRRKCAGYSISHHGRYMHTRASTSSA